MKAPLIQLPSLLIIIHWRSIFSISRLYSRCLSSVLTVPWLFSVQAEQQLGAANHKSDFCLFHLSLLYKVLFVLTWSIFSCLRNAEIFGVLISTFKILGIGSIFQSNLAKFTVWFWDLEVYFRYFNIIFILSKLSSLTTLHTNTCSLSNWKHLIRCILLNGGDVSL